jgi:hypothetical protein
MVPSNKHTFRAHDDIPLNRHATRSQKCRSWANARPLLKDQPGRETDTLAYDGSRMRTLYDKPR